jgi:hypothetical protein
MKDQDYMRRVAKLPCCAPQIRIVSTDDECDHQGPVQAHHAGRRPGTSLKADDRTCIALCLKHHAHWHGATGVFRGWDKQERRAWSDAAIEGTIAILGETPLIDGMEIP